MTTQADILGIPPRMNHNRPAPEPESLLPAVRDVPLIPAKPVAQYSTSTSILELRMLLEMAKRKEDNATVKFSRETLPYTGERTIRDAVISSLEMEPLSSSELAKRIGLKPRSVRQAVFDLASLGFIRPMDDSKRPKYEVVDKGAFQAKKERNINHTRFQIILDAFDGELCLNGICEKTDLTQTIARVAIRQMVQTGLLTYRVDSKHGKKIYSKA